MARSGLYKDRVEILRKGAPGGLDDYGNPARAGFGSIGRMSARVVETGAGEDLDGGRLVGHGTAKMTLRANSLTRAIDAAYRIRARGKVWAVVGVRDPDGRGRELEITMERGVSDAG